MADSPLRTNHAVNFKIPGEAKLMHFLADWIELEVSKVFSLTVVTPGNGQPNLVQLVPRGQSVGEDETYFHLLECSLGKSGMLEFWKQHAEFLPRAVAQVRENGGERTYETDFKGKRQNCAD